MYKRIFLLLCFIFSSINAGSWNSKTKEIEINEAPAKQDVAVVNVARPVKQDIKNARAQFELGLKFANGEGFNQNHQEAVKWFRRSAENGYKEAQLLLGAILFQGEEGISQNFIEAAKWLMEAAKQGDSSAQLLIGLFHIEGWGIEENYQEAFKWLLLAAENGNSYGQLLVGVMFLGHCHAEAEKYFLESAKQGNTKALFLLDQLHSGIFNKNEEFLENNISKALQLFNTQELPHRQKQFLPEKSPAEKEIPFLQKNKKAGLDGSNEEINSESERIANDPRNNNNSGIPLPPPPPPPVENPTKATLPGKIKSEEKQQQPRGNLLAAIRKGKKLRPAKPIKSKRNNQNMLEEVLGNVLEEALGKRRGSFDPNNNGSDNDSSGEWSD